MPNPEIVYRMGQTLLIFTAYMLEGKTSSQLAWEKESKEKEGKDTNDDKESNQSEDKEVKDSHFPTIYFYDLEKQKVEWEILGAEVFCSFIDNQKSVFYLTNPVWHSWDEYEINEYLEGDKSWYDEHKSSID